jgi:hypothetical protein
MCGLQVLSTGICTSSDPVIGFQRIICGGRPGIQGMPLRCSSRTDAGTCLVVLTLRGTLPIDEHSLGNRFVVPYKRIHLLDLESRGE